LSNYETVEKEPFETCPCYMTQNSRITHLFSYAHFYLLVLLLCKMSDE